MDIYKREKSIPMLIKKGIKLSDFETKILITDSDIDTNVMVQNLIQALSFAPEYRDPIIRTVFDLMGINTTILKPQPQMAMPGGDQNSQLAKPAGGKDMMGLIQEANTQ